MALSANIEKRTRKAVYARDGYRCALCDCTTAIQVHHVIPRGQGGPSTMRNLITLCGICHGQCHGMNLMPDLSQEYMQQLCVEYLADYYAEDDGGWNPWTRDPWDDRPPEKVGYIPKHE